MYLPEKETTCLKYFLTKILKNILFKMNLGLSESKTDSYDDRASNCVHPARMAGHRGVSTVHCFACVFLLGNTVQIDVQGDTPFLREF